MSTQTFDSGKEHGGPNWALHISMCNDTGSTVLSLFEPEIHALGFNMDLYRSAYMGYNANFKDMLVYKM